VSNCVGDFASKIDVPTLMIAGSKDDITTVQQQQATFAKLSAPRSSLEVISDVGHLTHYETPAQIAALVRDFSRGAR
jgi:pimeloyl-ACP methyl ester carboxylesterase